MNKITGLIWTLGPVKNISLIGGLNISSKPERDNFKAYLLGLSFDLSSLGSITCKSILLRIRTITSALKYGMQFTPVWSLPLTVASTKFRGFTDFRSGNTNDSGTFHILAQPHMLLDVGYLAGRKSDQIYVGTEYSY